MPHDENEKCEFVSYAFKDLSHKEIRKYASQYEGVDMATLMGADEDNFPFLVKDTDGGFDVFWWCSYSGLLYMIDEDSVRAYATVAYLMDHAYPRFESIEDAKAWAKSHDWPLKKLES
jgi:hypothetical protein